MAVNTVEVRRCKWASSLPGVRLQKRWCVSLGQGLVVEVAVTHVVCAFDSGHIWGSVGPARQCSLWKMRVLLAYPCGRRGARSAHVCAYTACALEVLDRMEHELEVAGGRLTKSGEGQAARAGSAAGASRPLAPQLFWRSCHVRCVAGLQ